MRHVITGHVSTHNFTLMTESCTQKRVSYPSEIMSHQCVMQKCVTFIRWEQSFVAGFVNCKHYIFDIDLTWSPRFDKEQPFITASKISAKQANQPVCIAVIFAQCLMIIDFCVCLLERRTSE